MSKTVMYAVLCSIVSLMLSVPDSAFACAACSGRSDDAVARGLNAAILTMLSVLLSVLGAIVGSVIYLIRRASHHSPMLPGAPEGIVR